MPRDRRSFNVHQVGFAAAERPAVASGALQVDPERPNAQGAVVPDPVRPRRVIRDQVAWPQHVRDAVDLDRQLALEHHALFVAGVVHRLLVGRAPPRDLSGGP